jgi:hypothetical protein
MQESGNHVADSATSRLQQGHQLIEAALPSIESVQRDMKEALLDIEQSVATLSDQP